MSVDTPVALGATVQRVGEVVLLVPILRAGLGMVQAIQEIVPLTEVAHVGLRREQATLRSDVYLNRLPRPARPAASSSATPCWPPVARFDRCATWSPTAGRPRCSALCIIASEPGLAAFGEAHPDVHVWCAAVDAGLNEAGFIVPGLGDAGDRLFGRRTEFFEPTRPTWGAVS